VVRHFQVHDELVPTSSGASIARLAAGGRSENEAMDVYERWFAEVPKGDRMMTQLVEGEAAGRLVPQDAFIGPPEACAAEIRRMRDEFHITDVIISGIASGPTTDGADANLRRFVEEVVPLVG
jgi:hypothetical protein